MSLSGTKTGTEPF